MRRLSRPSNGPSIRPKGAPVPEWFSAHPLAPMEPSGGNGAQVLLVEDVPPACRFGQPNYAIRDKLLY
eukprot:scaffold215133_cov39-Tisochrysis_lutea.AAC.2